MDILKEYELDQLKCALGMMTQGEMILKWTGEKHSELINTTGFVPTYQADECLKAVKMRQTIRSMPEAEKMNLFQRAIGGYGE